MITKQVHAKIKGIGSAKPFLLASGKVAVKVAGTTDFFELTDILVVHGLQLPSCELSGEISDFCGSETGVSVPPFKDTPVLLLGQDFIRFIVNLETIFLISPI